MCEGVPALLTSESFLSSRSIPAGTAHCDRFLAWLVVNNVVIMGHPNTWGTAPGCVRNRERDEAEIKPAEAPPSILIVQEVSRINDYKESARRSLSMVRNS
jgi:hypothetical protein